MKNIFLTLLVLFCITSIYAQVPEGINYQAVVRDASGNPLKNESVNIDVSIRLNSGSDYTESFVASTNEFGLLNVVLGRNGNGSIQLSDLAWDSGQALMDMTLTSSQGTVMISDQELLSVPFAYYAQTSGSSLPGPKGDQGDQGPQGLQGPKGDKGDTGPQGPAGQDGTGVNVKGSIPTAQDLNPDYMGEVGDMFITQDTGTGFVWDGTMWVMAGQIQGPKGDKGDVGDTGAQGPKGDQGDQGPQGLQGPKGDKGDMGDTGAQGPKGDQGDQGPQGLQGLKGDKGDVGDTGAQGPKGDQGDQGPQGLQGPKGDKGDMGDTGAQGPVGPQGPPGTYTAGVGISLSNGVISNTGDTDASNDLTIGTSAGGDLTGTYPNPTIRSINQIPFPLTTPSCFQTIKYNCQTDKWVFADDDDTNFWQPTTIGAYNGIQYKNLFVVDTNISGADLSFMTFNAGGSNDGPIILGVNKTVLAMGLSGTAQVVLEEVKQGDVDFRPNVHGGVDLGNTNRRWREIWSINGLNQSSDYRLKKNIEDLSYGLEAVMKMHPVKYDWKDMEGPTQLGFLAQEMMEVLPEVVTHGLEAADGDNPESEAQDTYGMYYNQIIPVLVRAIQEQQREIEELKKVLKK